MSYQELLSQVDARASGFSLTVLNKLKELNLNIITAESITGGLIVQTLVDKPGFSKWIYGSFVTYDSDAKRDWLSVRTGDVYTKEVAEEMATGAVSNSRALVGLSVTGCGGPTPEDKVGEVYVGLCMTIPVGKRSNGNTRVGKMVCSQMLRICDYPDMKEFIAQNEKSAERDKQIRTLIRHYVVGDALKFLLETIGELESRGIFSGRDHYYPLINKEYDGVYTRFGEPSPVIASHLKKN